MSEQAPPQPEFIYKNCHSDTMRLLDAADPTQTASATYANALEFAQRYIEPHVEEYEATGIMNSSIWPGLGKAGLLGFIVEEKYGGNDLGYLPQHAAIQAISYVSPGVGLNYLAGEVLGIGQISGYAHEKQKMEYLPDLCAGKTHSAICITEPHSGSDTASMKSTAEYIDGNIIINLKKAFITLGGTAQVLVAYAKTDKKNIGAFILDKNDKLTSILMDKAGMKSSQTYEVFVDNYTGTEEETQLGTKNDGQKIMLSGFPIEREQLVAQSSAIALSSFDIAFNYLCTRYAFDDYLINKPVIRHQLTEMYGKIQMLQKAAYATAAYADRGRKLPTREERYAYLTNADGSLLKNEAGQLACQITSKCVTLGAGAGYLNSMRLMRNMNDAHLNTFGGGGENVCNIAGQRDLFKKHKPN